MNTSKKPVNLQLYIFPHVLVSLVYFWEIMYFAFELKYLLLARLGVSWVIEGWAQGFWEWLGTFTAVIGGNY